MSALADDEDAKTLADEEQFLLNYRSDSLSDDLPPPVFKKARKTEHLNNTQSPDHSDIRR